MTKHGSWTGIVSGGGIANCRCRAPLLDSAGRVLGLQTCPACQDVRLDIIRGGEYAGAYMRCGDAMRYVLLKQKEFFSR